MFIVISFIITKKLEQSKHLLIFVDNKEINKGRKIGSKQMKSNQEVPEKQSNYTEAEDLEIKTALSKRMVGEINLTFQIWCLKLLRNYFYLIYLWKFINSLLSSKQNIIHIQLINGNQLNTSKVRQTFSEELPVRSLLF